MGRVNAFLLYFNIITERTKDIFFGQLKSNWVRLMIYLSYFSTISHHMYKRSGLEGMHVITAWKQKLNDCQQGDSKTSARHLLLSVKKSALQKSHKTVVLKLPLLRKVWKKPTELIGFQSYLYFNKLSNCVQTIFNQKNTRLKCITVSCFWLKWIKNGWPDTCTFHCHKTT